MPDKPKTEPKVTGKSKSGMFPRPSFAEPDIRRDELRHEAPPPPQYPPEYFDAGATTGAMPVITEGDDDSAERDNDRVSGGV